MPRTARKTVVFLDSREPVNVRNAISDLLPEIPKTYALREGDVLMVDPDGCVLGIERKTVSDFLNSLASGRLIRQLTRMSQSYAHQGLIIEGKYRVDGEGYLSMSIGTRWTHAAYQMTLWSLQVHFPRLVVWHTNDLACTADIIRSLADRGRTKGCFTKTTLLAHLPKDDPADGDDDNARPVPLADARRTRRAAAGNGR